MRIIGFVLGTALLALATAAPARASVKDGVDAWSRGDYADAVAEWEQPALAGDADARFNLAQAYKLGKGVPTDLDKAEELYRKAAEQGHLQAADLYGLLLFRSGRREAAMPWIVASAERGEPRAQYVLGIAHFNGDMVAKDPVRAYALMTRAAAAGLETATETLGAMDRALPLDQRQQGVALAADLDATTSAARSTQLAAVGLGAAEALAPIEAIPVAPSASGPMAAPALAPGAWRIQLGAFGVAGNAQALWAKLKSNAAFSEREGFFVPAGKLTKLQAGPFASRAEAQAACAAMAGQACIPVRG